MRRPRPGVLAELLPVALVLLALAGTTGLVVVMHRHAATSRQASTPRPSQITVALPKPAAPELLPPPETAPPVPVVVQPPPPAPEDPTAKALARVASQADEQRAALAEADRKAAALEAARKLAVLESEKWRRKESLVRAQVDRIASQADRLDAEADALAAERDVLARERDAAKAALVKARSRDGGYAVLPHRGVNGTWQRPVMIECTDGVAILQPSGQRFTMIDMSPLTSPRGSPLISAVARELIKAHRATTPDGAPVVPYIYFVVRPDGIRPFYEARGRLEPLGIAFGYELVEQNWEIDFPNLDDPATWDGTAPTSSRPGDPLASTTTPRLSPGLSDRNSPGNSPGDPRGNGPADFVWPSDRPQAARNTPSISGNRDDPDAFMWPATPPGGDEGTGPGRPGSLTGSSGLATPGVGPHGKPPGVSDIDAEGIIRGGLASIRGDVESAEGASQNRSAIRRPGTRPGFSRPTVGGPSPRPSTTPGSDPGTGHGPAIVPLGPDGLPILDPADPSRPGTRPGPRSGTGPGTGSTGTGTGPVIVGSTPPGTASPPAPGQPDPALVPYPSTPGSTNPQRPSPGFPQGAPNPGPATSLPPAVAEALNPPPLPPLPPGRVRIDPEMLARALDDDPFGDTPAAPENSGPSSGPKGPRGSGSPGGPGTPPPPGASSSPSGLSLPPIGSDAGDPTRQDKHPVPSRSPAGRTDRKKVIDVPLELIVSCSPAGVVVHPGGYRLTPGTLRKPGILKRDLQTIVRNHELIDPMVRPRPRLQFLIEPGGSETYWEARRQTVLDGLDWPVSIEVAGPQATRVFPKERF